MKRVLLVLLVVALSISICSCGKSEEVIAAENAIKAIGDVTVESGDAISQAEKAVGALSAEEKEKFKMNDDLEEIKKQYNNLLNEEKVNEVVKLIDNLGEVSLNSGDKIDAAEKAYNQLDSEYKGKVTNKNKLDSAISTLETLRTAEKERIIAEKTPLFNLEHDKVENITWYEHKNLPRYIDIRSYIIPFIGKNSSGAWISTRYNYTGDEWIFWEDMTIMVDGKKYYKSVEYSDLIRDNDTEVWEYYEEPLSYNVGMDNYELKMLKAISESEETIIRFQGDEYHYDLYVSDTDKRIIADVLALYQALIW